MRRTLEVVTLASLLLVAGNVFGQTFNGQIGGIVSDPSKALIPGATITLTNTGTGDRMVVREIGTQIDGGGGEGESPGSRFKDYRSLSSQVARSAAKIQLSHELKTKQGSPSLATLVWNDR